MSEIIQFNKTDEALFIVAKERSERGNFVGALDIFLDLEEKGFSDVELFAEIAIAYTSISLFTTSCYYWFKYLALTKDKPNKDYCPNKKIGYNLFRMGNHPLGALYYERSLDSEYDPESDNYSQDDELYDEYLDDDVGLNNSEYFYLLYRLPQKSNFKVVDKLIGDGKMFDAMQLLLSVDENDERYVESQIRYATCLFINKQIEEAVDCLTELQKKYPYNEYVLETLVSSIFASSNHGKIESLLSNINEIELTSVSLCYNVANYYCHINNESKAKEFLEKALMLDADDPDVHYFYALLLFNSGEYAKALEHFVFCHKVYRDIVMNYYFDYCQKVVRGEVEPKRLPYARDIPEEASSAIMAEIAKIVEKGAKFAKTVDIDRLIELAKYLVAVGSVNLEEYLLVLSYLKDNKIKKYLLSTLYNLAISEKTKQKIIERIIANGFSNTLYFTYGGVFMTSKIYRAIFQKEHKKLFEEAYAYAVSHIVIIENDNIFELCKGATRLYEKLEANDAFGELVLDKNALAVAMVVNSSLDISKKRSMLLSFLRAQKDNVSSILKLAKGRKKKNEDC